MLSLIIQNNPKQTQSLMYLTQNTQLPLRISKYCIINVASVNNIKPSIDQFTKKSCCQSIGMQFLQCNQSTQRRSSAVTEQLKPQTASLYFHFFFEDISRF